MKRTILIAVVISTLAGCGGPSIHSSTAYRVAVHVAKWACRAIDAIPDEPGPDVDAGVAGGESPR